MRKVYFFLFVLIFTNGFSAIIRLNGDKFTDNSYGVKVDHSRYPNSAKIGSFKGGYAIYEFTILKTVVSFNASVLFENPNSKPMDIYIYNYGTKRDDESIRKSKLDPHWIIWESTSTANNWSSSRPDILPARSSSGVFDFTGGGDKIKLLLYADGGIPFFTTEVFYINRVILDYSCIEISGFDLILEKIEQSRDVWIEGDRILARGKGYAPPRALEAQKRALAKRAAKVVALRNLMIVLSDTTQGIVKGARVKESIPLEDGGVEVILELPLQNLRR